MLSYWDSVVQFLGSSHAYWLLFLSAFTSSTLLPGSSEVVLTSTLLAGSADIERIVLLVLIATLGNSLGGMTSYALGRFFPSQKEPSIGMQRLKKWGIGALFFSWMPIVGDALPVAAGWLRMPMGLSFVIMSIGRLIRYSIVVAIAYGFI